VHVLVFYPLLNGNCNFALLLNLLLILFVNIQHWCPKKLLLMVRLMVLEATSLLSSVVLLSSPQMLAQSSCHYQLLSCYFCQYMSRMPVAVAAQS